MRGNYSAIRHCERTLRSNLLAKTGDCFDPFGRTPSRNDMVYSLNLLSFQQPQHHRQ